MTDSQLRARFEARWETLALEHTLGADARASLGRRAEALATAATLGAPGDASAPPAPPLVTLPRISLTAAGAAAETHPPTSERADLRVLGLLGEGGMGRVYVAEQHSLGRRVAVKTLKDDAGGGARAALLSEAVITGFLEHPGIIPVHALGLDDAGRPLLVMKRVEGVSWHELIHDPEHPAWSWETLHDDPLVAHLEIFAQVCNAVSFAHESGIVHRDIKPANVMIGRFGEVYLLDWGMGLRLEDDPALAAGQLVGTPGYMAPEMVMGGAVGPAADVYLLGATLHEILTRTLRHTGASLHDLLLAAYESAPVVYGGAVPAELAELANLATRRDPAERPASAAELRRRVKAYLRHRGSRALSDAASERLARFREILSARGDSWLGEARRLSSQARFGFDQALEQWPENPGAREGLRETSRAIVEMEVARDDPAAARAALEDLADPPPDLVATVNALERRHEAARAEATRLQVIVAELDPTVSRKQRLWSAAILLVLTLLVSVVALRHRAAGGLAHGDLVRFGGFVLAGVLGGIAVFRRALFRNEFNRRVSGTFIIGAVAIVAHRLLLWPFEPPIATVFAGDLLLLSIVAGIGALTLLRWLAYPALCLLSGAVATALLPDQAPLVFSGSTLVSLAMMVLFWRRTA